MTLPRAATLAALGAAWLLLGAVPPAAAAPAPISPVDCAGVSCAEPIVAEPAIAVDDLAALRRALTGARGGEVIALAPGDHGALTLSGLAPASPVTVRSADPSNPARLSGLTLTDVSNLTLEGLVFDYRFAPGDLPRRTRPFTIRGGRDLTVRRSTFDGDVASGTGRPEDDGLPIASALMAQGTRGLTVGDSLFTGFWRAAGFTSVDDLVFAGNRVEGMRSEGLNVVAVRGALIEGNHFAAFRTSTASDDHPDMIQFWTTNTERPSSDVVIRGNLFDVSGGRATHTILMGNQAVDRGAGREMFFQDVLIEQNVIAAAHRHGISVGQSDGLVVRRNTLARMPRAAPLKHGRALSIPTIRVHPASLDVLVEGNVTGPARTARRSRVMGPVAGHQGQPSWRVSGNVLAQDEDPAAPGWYGDLFVDATRLDRPLDGLRYAADGPLASGAAGADRLRLDLDGAALVPLLRASPTGRAPNHFALDAGATLTPQGVLSDVPGAVVTWRLPDGGTAEGMRITRALAPGDQVAEALITLPGGAEAVAALAVSVPSPSPVEISTPGPFDLRAGSVAPLDLSELDGMGATDLTVALSLKVSDPEPVGRILAVRGGAVLSLTPLGGLEARIRRRGGDLLARTGPLGLNRDGPHDVALRLGADGSVGIALDGALRAQAAPPPGTSGGATRHHLTLGHRDPARGAGAIASDLVVEARPPPLMPPGAP